MYISEDCNWTPYGTNPELDKKVDSNESSIRWDAAGQGHGLDKLINDEVWQVRSQVARKGYGLDKLVNDKNSNVRYEVARQGYGLDILINDEDYAIRKLVVRQGYGLDKLVNDKDWGVRKEVAEQGYGLDILINDEADEVREAVAKQGYGLDKLIDDDDENVFNAVRSYLREHNLTLEKWVKLNPNKCVLDNGNSPVEKAIKNFIYKIDESNKLEAQFQYDSIDEFFYAPISDNKMNTLAIYSIDTKILLFEIEKVQNEIVEYKFIVDITTDRNENFSIKTFIQSREQLNKLIEQTIEALKLYSQFNKYADELENCL